MNHLISGTSFTLIRLAVVSFVLFVLIETAFWPISFAARADEATIDLVCRASDSFLRLARVSWRLEPSLATDGHSYAAVWAAFTASVVHLVSSSSSIARQLGSLHVWPLLRLRLLLMMMVRWQVLIWIISVLVATRGLVGLWNNQISVLLFSWFALRSKLWRNWLVEIRRIHHVGWMLRRELTRILLNCMATALSRGSLLVVHHRLHLLVSLGVRRHRWLHVVMGQVRWLIILSRMRHVLVQAAIVLCFMINISTTTAVLKLCQHSILVLLLGCLSSSCRCRWSLSLASDPWLPWLGWMLLRLLRRIWLLSANHSYLLDHLGDMVSLGRDKLVLLVLVRRAVSCGGCEWRAAIITTATSKWLHP